MKIRASTQIQGLLPLANAGLGFDASGIAKGGMLSGTGAGTVGITVAAADGLVWTLDAASAGGAKWYTASAGTMTDAIVSAHVAMRF